MSRKTRKIQTRHVTANEIFTSLSFLALLILFAVGIFLLISPSELFLFYALLACAGIVLGLLGIWRNLKNNASPWAIPPMVAAVLHVVALIFMISTLNISQTAYGACRNMAKNHIGYGIWQSQGTIQQTASASITFSDGTNLLECQPIPVGPLWAARPGLQTLVECYRNGPCPKGYFGVSP